MQSNETQQQSTAGKNASRSSAALAAAAALGLLIVLGGCSSSAAGQANMPSTQTTLTPPPETTTPPTDQSPSIQAQDPQADGYWFTVTERFAGAAQWHVSVRPPTDPTDTLGLGGVGEIEFDGPNQAKILLESPIDIGQFETVMQELKADVTQRQITLDGAPLPMGLGGAPAAIGSGLDSFGKHVDLITAMNPSNRTYTDVTLTCAPADITTDRAVLQTLLHSFRFEH